MTTRIFKSTNNTKKNSQLKFFRYKETFKKNFGVFFIIKCPTSMKKLRS